MWAGGRARLACTHQIGPGDKLVPASPSTPPLGKYKSGSRYYNRFWQSASEPCAAQWRSQPCTSHLLVASIPKCGAWVTTVGVNIPINVTRPTCWGWGERSENWREKSDQRVRRYQVLSWLSFRNCFVHWTGEPSPESDNPGNCYIPNVIKCHE